VRSSPTGNVSRVHGGARGLHHRAVADPHRLTKVGLPGAEEGLTKADPTIAETA